MNRIILAALLVVVAIVGGAAAFTWYRTFHGGKAFGGSFVLVDHNGEEITERAFRGKPSAVFFGFTHCPEVCPTTLFELDAWLDELGDRTRDVQAFFVSVDPERDTPEVMKTYISNFSDRIVGITGAPDKVAAMLKDFAIYARRVELEGGDYTMDHTASILLLDRSGDLFGTIAYGENPETARQKLLRLAEGSR